jgi:hypothetical protein
MEAILMTLTIIAGLVSLGLASNRWGIDTREGMADDHARSA